MKRIPPPLAFIFLSLSFLSCTKQNEETNGLFSVNLKTLDGKTISLSELKENAASVILFIQPECPFCNSYGKTIRILDSTFRAMQVKTYGVVAGTNFPEEDIKAYREKHRLLFPILLDPEFVLTRNLKATITPQAFLLDRDGNTLYHGMIDNWGYEIGKVRAKATEFYLSDAVIASVNGKPVPIDSTKAVGCFIQ